MDQFDPNQLIKLAAACRKAGIKSFKGNGVEFTLSDDAPVKGKPRGKSAKAEPIQDSAPDKFETDALTEEQLMYWSTGGLSESEGTQ